MQQHRPLFVTKNSVGARKICRDCGYFVFGRMIPDEKNCGHPVNISDEVDVITGNMQHNLTNYQMREDVDLCGPFGNLWISRSALQDKLTAETVAREAIPRAPRSRTIGIDDI